jgi:hypothetical protein
MLSRAARAGDLPDPDKSDPNKAVSVNPTMGVRRYWLGWPERFDHLPVEHFVTDIDLLPPWLHRVAMSDVADLYRIGSRTRGSQLQVT